MRIKRFMKLNKRMYFSILLLFLYFFVNYVIVNPIKLNNDMIQERIKTVSDPENTEEVREEYFKNKNSNIGIDKEVKLFSKISEDLDIISLESKVDETGKRYLFKVKNDMGRFENFLANMEKNKYGAMIKEVVILNEGRNSFINITIIMN